MESVEVKKEGLAAGTVEVEMEIEMGGGAVAGMMEAMEDCGGDTVEAGQRVVQNQHC